MAPIQIKKQRHIPQTLPDTLVSRGVHHRYSSPEDITVTIGAYTAETSLKSTRQPEVGESRSYPPYPNEAFHKHRAEATAAPVSPD
jgi:hypothetical protein